MHRATNTNDIHATPSIVATLRCRRTSNPCSLSLEISNKLLACSEPRFKLMWTGLALSLCGVHGTERPAERQEEESVFDQGRRDVQGDELPPFLGSHEKLIICGREMGQDFFRRPPFLFQFGSDMHFNKAIRSARQCLLRAL